MFYVRDTSFILISLTMEPDPPTPIGFPGLPKELRLTIWELALVPEPRRITAHEEIDLPKKRSKALRINVEAREVALEYYSLIPAKFVGGLWGQKYVSFTDDYFDISWSAGLANSKSGNMVFDITGWPFHIGAKFVINKALGQG
jgi:hypothetical protein